MKNIIELGEGEYVVTYFRKHWWRITTWGFSLVVLSFLPLLFITLFFSLVPNVDISQFINPIGMFYCIWLSVLWILFFIEWTDYYLDVWVLTNRKVVDIDHTGLFARDVSVVALEDIEDITTEVHGILSVFLKFGTITLQTAGSRNEFYLRNAANPERARKIIYGLVEEIKHPDHKND